MLTIFTTPKAFRGHINVIQRNALKSWTLLHPDVEVILFGDEEGAAEAARELGIRHEPHVERNEFGTNLLNDMFRKTEASARHDVLCYVNCDIILTDDFLRAFERVQAKYSKFLMVGRRWDAPITQPVDFSDPAWGEKVRNFALSANAQRDEWWIDYFVFSRGLYGGDMPAFAVGRVGWDNWMIWKALDSKLPVVDVSPPVSAVHQNHDYSHHPQGKQGVWEGEEAKRNLSLAGGWDHLRTIMDATTALCPGGFRHNWRRHYLRALTRPWLLLKDDYEFRLRTPGRFRYFAHRCRSNLVLGGRMTGACRAYSWTLAVFELMVGRERSHYLEGVRTRVKRSVVYLRRGPRD